MHHQHQTIYSRYKALCVPHDCNCLVELFWDDGFFMNDEIWLADAIIPMTKDFRIRRMRSWFFDSWRNMKQARCVMSRIRNFFVGISIERSENIKLKCHLKVKKERILKHNSFFIVVSSKHSFVTTPILFTNACYSTSSIIL